MIVLNVLMSVFYLGNFLFKGILVSAGGGRSVEADHAIALAARELTDDELPVFTVLVPMYREARDAADAGAGAARRSTIRSASSTSSSCSRPTTTRPSRSRARSASKACSR